MGIGTEEDEDEPDPPEPFEYVDEDWTKFLPQIVSVISYHKNNFDKCNKRKKKTRTTLRVLLTGLKGRTLGWVSLEC